MTLDLMPANANGRVVDVDEQGLQVYRLMEMGLVPGVSVRMVKSAPLGDPIQVCVRGYHLALRRSEARAITVELALEKANPTS